MGLWRVDSGANRDLMNRLRAERQLVQGGRWRPAGTDACLDRQSKTRMSVLNRVQR